MAWIEAWATRRYRPQRSPVRLDRQRIYILPTGYGYLFALLLLVMFLWAINYNNSMGFALTFLLAAVALNAMWRSHGNLLELQVQMGSIDPVFAGQAASFNYGVTNPDPYPRYGIALQGKHGLPQYADLPAQGAAGFTLTMPTARRGLLRPGRLQVLTRFPLGLFQAWSWLEFEQTCIVYPQPRGRRPLPSQAASLPGSGAGEWGMGSEDYAGLRAYVPGDSPRHIAWKAVAQGRGLLVKRFTDQSRPGLWLDWELLAPEQGEARLAQLCQWVLKAEAEEREYGLRLPGLVLSPGSGEQHRRRCLEALALYSPSASAANDRG